MHIPISDGMVWHTYHDHLTIIIARTQVPCGLAGSEGITWGVASSMRMRARRADPESSVFDQRLRHA